MRYILSVISMIIVTCLTHSAGAQVQVSFLPSIHGSSLDGLTFFQVNNQAVSDFNCAVKITVSEDKTGKIAELYASSVYVKKGLNYFSRSAFGKSSVHFSSNEIASLARQTGKFPEGDYEYCFELRPLDSKPGIEELYENCFHHTVQPLAPLLLVDPVDAEKICNTKPPFIWQSPMPVNFNARYRILVVEVNEKQTSAEALSYNQPVINTGELREPRLSYPMHIKELKKGKQYAWQIYYSVNNMLITKSEIWTFRIDCEEEKEIAGDDSYRELKPGIQGDFYVAQGKLKFAFYNPYNDGELQYSIVNLKEQEKHLESLPKLKLVTGANKYQLDLAAYRAFKQGEHYQLQVQLPNGQQLFLRFTYQEK